MSNPSLSYPDVLWKFFSLYPRRTLSLDNPVTVWKTSIDLTFGLPSYIYCKTLTKEKRKSFLKATSRFNVKSYMLTRWKKTIGRLSNFFSHLFQNHFFRHKITLSPRQPLFLFVQSSSNSYHTSSKVFPRNSFDCFFFDLSIPIYRVFRIETNEGASGKRCPPALASFFSTLHLR